VKTYLKAELLDDNFVKSIPDGSFICSDVKIRVILDLFKGAEHYVVGLDNNWIAKEFMQVVYDPKYANETNP
jgi:hypothetical protein